VIIIFLPLFDALALMLPPGFERRVLTTVSLTHCQPDTAALTEKSTETILKLLQRKGAVRLNEIEALLGKRAQRDNHRAALWERGLAERHISWKRIKVKTLFQQFIPSES